MNTDNIKDRFNLIARDYDSQRRMFISCYDDYYLSMVDFISRSFNKPKTIVDLGAGTGLLTKFFYDKYPDANYILIDISDQMLEVAKRRFEGINTFHYIVSDYTTKLNFNDVDLVISGLSMHHMTNNEKLNLYKNIYNKLTPQGVFANFDQFNAESSAINELYNKYWYNQIQNSGLLQNEYDKWLKRRELDKENTIEETINMLKQSGFNSAECIYKYMKFGVVIAQKIT